MTHGEMMRWLIALGCAVGTWFLGWLVFRLVVGPLARALRSKPTDLDEIVLTTLEPHLPVWFLLLGIFLGARALGLAAPQLAVVDKAVQVLFLASVTFAVSSFVTRWIAGRSAHLPAGLPATNLTRNAIRIVVLGLGAMVIVANLGIEITPLLTALGVSSLAVALALQPTLSNLFAGLHITLARRIRVGDFVELDGGQQGYVADIGWRSTQIRELPNNLIIVPNAHLAEIVVKNYSLPVNEQSALVQVGVSYSSDLDRVERVTVDVAREVQRTVPGALPAFEPFIRYHTFGDSAIGFSVILRVKEFTDRYLVTHEFVKRLHRAYAEAGIEIPFPQRVVHVARDADGAAPGAGKEGGA